MRGTDPEHHLHVTEKGDPKFLGFAYYAESEDDLAKLAKAPGASAIETIDEPGGGKRVRLTEPNGYQHRSGARHRDAEADPARRGRRSTPARTRRRAPAS